MTDKSGALIIVPANNTTMVHEIMALCPELAPISVARVPRAPRTLTREDLPAYAEGTLAAIEPFIAVRPKLVFYGCTAAGFLSGPDGNRKIIERLSARLRAKVVSTADAMVQALQSAGVSSAAVVTPYVASVNAGLRTYLENSGIRVEVLESFFCETTDQLGRVTEEQVRDLALRTVTPASEALFIACSQLPTLRILPELRAQLHIPVWSSIGATAWAGRRALAMADAMVIQ
jgi:maleate cis-trans isomerase